MIGDTGMQIIETYLTCCLKIFVQIFKGIAVGGVMLLLYEPFPPTKLSYFKKGPWPTPRQVTSLTKGCEGLCSPLGRKALPQGKKGLPIREEQ